MFPVVVVVVVPALSPAPLPARHEYTLSAEQINDICVIVS